MAKISARGARKLAEASKSLDTGAKVVLVLASDGRILYRIRYSKGESSGFSIYSKIKDARNKTEAELREVFQRIADRRGYTIR